MRRFITLYKKRGETPLVALTAWKEANPLYSTMAASYAGRLDPMAEGKLLILLGNECKKQKRYTNLEKEYEIEVLLDVGSDTGDALGLIEASGRETRIDTNFLQKILHAEEGIHTRLYPVYSSKTINGKPLFLYALEGTLNTIQVPEHKEHIYRIQYLGSRTVSTSALQQEITNFLALVPRSDEPSKVLGADFRIDAVRASWEKVFTAFPQRQYVVLKLRVSCGSGTYMRSLAGRIGVALSTHALALSISRTKIGKRFCGIWIQEY